MTDRPLLGVASVDPDDPCYTGHHIGETTFRKALSGGRDLGGRGVDRTKSIKALLRSVGSRSSRLGSFEPLRLGV